MYQSVRTALVPLKMNGRLNRFNGTIEDEWEIEPLYQPESYI
jgi:hypothetical protein